MSFLSLLGVEFKKIRRSKIMLILSVAVIALWLPSIFNANMNFQMQAEGISPEYNFWVQGFLAMLWFIFPASMVVSTVLLNQTERINKGILKMLALPISKKKIVSCKIHGIAYFSGNTSPYVGWNVLFECRHCYGNTELRFYIIAVVCV